MEYVYNFYMRKIVSISKKDEWSKATAGSKDQWLVAFLVVDAEGEVFYDLLVLKVLALSTERTEIPLDIRVGLDKQAEELFSVLEGNIVDELLEQYDQDVDPKVFEDVAERIFGKMIFSPKDCSGITKASLALDCQAAAINAISTYAQGLLLGVEGEPGILQATAEVIQDAISETFPSMVEPAHRAYIAEKVGTRISKEFGDDFSKLVGYELQQELVPLVKARVLELRPDLV
jgi:hypothetical protein